MKFIDDLKSGLNIKNDLNVLTKSPIIPNGLIWNILSSNHPKKDDFI